jgi:hypothetical protein
MPCTRPFAHARRVTKLDRRRGAILTGFLVPLALLALIALAYRNDFFASSGWHGGEYAYAFIWTALGSIVVGAVVRLTAAAPWRSIGSGMMLVGSAGMLVVIALVVVFIAALANFDMI